MSSLTDHISHMRRHFRSGAMRSIASRKRHLESLQAAIVKHENEVLDALHKDLGKNRFEAYSNEISYVLTDIKETLANLDEWAEPRKVATPITVYSAQATLHPQARGIVLIICPWNYPFQLVMAPLVAAIAAGNVCVVKPSELSPHTTEVCVRILGDAFSQDVVYPVIGDASVATELLKHAWDHVFFTGGTKIGKIIAKACAENLTPCTLELGGKSPAIIDQGVSLKSVARKIAFGKFLNAGQTCIGVDYVLVHESQRDDFIKALRATIREFYGDDPQKSPDYGRIINFTHYERISAMITSGYAIHGGRRDRADRYIEPTIIDGVTLDHPAMADEIFGPVLPILTWREKGQIYTILEANPNPLALYLFTKDKDFEKEITESVPFGGGCVNHTLLHFLCPELPFGGVRQSGLGSYHGKFGFDTFTHYKGVLKAGLFDIPIKYPKHRPWKIKVLKFLERFL